MKFLKILERAWLAATATALLLGLYYLATIRAINHLVYFPLFCSLFCYLIYRNIRSQREFVEKRDQERKD